MQWHVQRKSEFYYKKARELGYRSRAAFKLLEIQKKFRIIRRGDKILDLGAAPGSWSQAAAAMAGENGLVVGVDVQPVPNIGKNFRFVLSDIAKESSEAKISKIRNTFDVVLSDTSPETTGIKDIDIGISEALAFKSLYLAAKFLRAGGNFACKIFQGRDFGKFLGEARKHFKKVYSFKPESSDEKSSEIYIVCTNLKERAQHNREKQQAA